MPKTSQLDRTARTIEDILELLDSLLQREGDDRTTGEGADFWDAFYADRSRTVPFFVAKPDENLASYLDRGLLTAGRALDPGYGPGRNSRYLAAHGFHVEPIDVSPVAIAWAQERTTEVRLDIPFHRADAFESAADKMGSQLSNADLYRERRPQGGLGYIPESLRWIFDQLTEVELRRMRDEPPDSPHFGEPSLWTPLFRRDK